LQRSSAPTGKDRPGARNSSFRQRNIISVPFSSNPDYDATITPLRETLAAGQRRYEPLACGPYVEAAYRAAWPQAETQ
jgi:hypothetical protein